MVPLIYIVPLLLRRAVFSNVTQLYKYIAVDSCIHQRGECNIVACDRRTAIHRSGYGLAIVADQRTSQIIHDPI